MRAKIHAIYDDELGHADVDADYSLSAVDSRTEGLRDQLRWLEDEPLRENLERWGLEMPPHDEDFQRHARRALDKEWRVRIEFWSRNVLTPLISFIALGVAIYAAIHKK